jgi:hypothetical protein
MLDVVIEAIPIEAMKGPVKDLVTMCGKKGNTKILIHQPFHVLIWAR